jgi:ATP-dependent protease ClpP protease subunit
LAALNPAMANDLRNTQLGWYTIRNAADSADPNQGSVPDDEAEVLIYDEIGGSFGVSADQFVQDLSAITSPKIKLRINSPGGSLFDSIAIYNALVQHKAYVTTYVDSLAASGASIIALAGDAVIMMPGSQMMIHDALGMEMGNARDMTAMAAFLDRQSENIASIYSRKAGGDVSEWRDKMLAETWMFDSEAVESGLADAIYTKAADADEDSSESETIETEESDDDDEKTVPNPTPEEEENDSEHDVEALMNRRHTLRNRGFKYSGRLHAPTPDTKTSAANVRTLREFLSEGLFINGA